MYWSVWASLIGRDSYIYKIHNSAIQLVARTKRLSSRDCLESVSIEALVLSTRVETVTCILSLVSRPSWTGWFLWMGSHFDLGISPSELGLDHNQAEDLQPPFPQRFCSSASFVCSLVINLLNTVVAFVP